MTWDRAEGKSRAYRNRFLTPVERFWQKVNVTVDGCWDWLGGAGGKGHGAFMVDRKNVGAHRFAYELMVGAIPDGAHLDHLCRNPSCVRPTHLEPVSLWENLRRSNTQVAVINASKTHCKRGHEFTPENTYTGNGNRACRQCAHDRYIAKKASK